MTITYSDLSSPCFTWHPYGKLGLFKTELVIGSIKWVILTLVIGKIFHLKPAIQYVRGETSSNENALALTSPHSYITSSLTLFLPKY